MYGGILTTLEELTVKTVIVSEQFEESQNYELFKEIVKKRNIRVIFVKKRR